MIIYIWKRYSNNLIYNRSPKSKTKWTNDTFVTIISFLPSFLPLYMDRSLKTKRRIDAHDPRISGSRLRKHTYYTGDPYGIPLTRVAWNYASRIFPPAGWQYGRGARPRGCHLWKSHAIIRRQIWAAAVWSKFGLFLPLPRAHPPLLLLVSSTSFPTPLSLSRSFEFRVYPLRARSSPGTDVLIGRPARLEASMIVPRDGSKDDAFARHLLINDVFRGGGGGDSKITDVGDYVTSTVEWRWRSERVVESLVFQEFCS